METTKSIKKILKILLKDFTIEQTVTSLAKAIVMSRVGIWKILKKLQSEEVILLPRVGTGKTNTYIIRLNWDNPLIEKMLSLILTEDALKNQRWLNNFLELENKVDFLILYGSIISYPKEAGDIDVLNIVSNNSKFLEIEESIKKIQKTQIKKIHALNITQSEFKRELKKPNQVFIDAVKKGIVLFGQEKFIKFIIGLSKK